MKNICTIILTFLYLLIFLVNAQGKERLVPAVQHKYTNQLIHESSPYLLQHAHNPVNWYPWGKSGFEKAEKENKLIIVSIGYSSCHWCHVMEVESFENEEIAKIMNENYVAIKVDREERPDIDQIYMNAIQLLTGSGGWPLNCITMPNREPFFCGTYFPKEKWLEILIKVADFVKQNPEKTKLLARQVTDGVRSSEINFATDEKAEFSIKDLNGVFAAWQKNIDYLQGGSKGEPKFPMPIGYQFLLHYNFLVKNPDVLKAVTVTLDKMAAGGIYDQVGGGFSRYSTDQYWKVPHFEKMLYDNALLVSLYSRAYQQTKNPKYKTVVQETLAFIKREMTSHEGGFFSSLDADSDGEEGKYYVWKLEELKNILGREADFIIDYYNLTLEGNWEDRKNILYISATDKQLAEKYQITESELNNRVFASKEILLKERSARVHPGLDDKIITSWNALMLKAYIDAFEVFGNEDYLTAALKNAEFIASKLKSADHRLNRNYKNEKAGINAYLDDYAFSISAFISLYQVTFSEKWLDTARKLTDYAIDHFFENKSGMFFYTSDLDPALIARKKEIIDNVMPASNSEMAKNLFVLGYYFYNEEYLEKSSKMLNSVKKYTLNGGSYFANWDILMAWFSSEPYEVAIVGKEFEHLRREFKEHYLPIVFFSGGSSEGTLSLLENKLVEGETTIYVCQFKVCKLPVTDTNAALTQIFDQ